ncbi:uncharacterized protein JCM15063_003697 [Sporobolomyces koalae]|uniref:uncharacterized protein n=1 Tax=Sporobolomyces koalae TaxID=500713 RepID=UPI00316C1B7B
MTRITLCYDIVSPWSYFAYYILRRYEQAWDFDLVLKPMFLGGVMKESGNRPPLTVQNKGTWMNKVDLPLLSKMSDIGYKFPETFPINTIEIARCLRAIEKLHPDKLQASTEFFWELFWKRSEGNTAKEASEPEFFGKKLVSSRLFTQDEVSKITETAKSSENKEALKSEATDLVQTGGAFGFPWIIVEKEQGGEKHSFFGADRFEHIAFVLNKPWSGPRGPNHMAKL